MNELVILGEKQVEDLFKMAPKVFTNEVTHFLWKERLMFVGNKKEMGTFRRGLLRKKRKFYDGTWGQGMARAFTGNLNRPTGRLSNVLNSLDGLELSMGVIDKWKRRIPYLEFLSEGGTVRPKNKEWLMIPFYKNLRSVGLFGRIGSNIHDKKNWTRWRRENQIRMGDFVPFHGKLLVFGDIPKEEQTGTHFNRHLGRLHRKLLFVGVKRVNVKKQFDFEKSFERRKPAIINRAIRMTEKTVQQMDKGKIWTR